MQEVIPDNTELIKAINMKMPFGKYKGHILLNLPEHYLVWFRQRGFPKGKLGERLQLMYEIKLNGLEDSLRVFISKTQGRIKKII